MSKTIDEKVVQMKFNNGQFERNVAKSMQTLDSLKFKLKTMDFRKSAADLENVGNAAKKIDMSGLSQGIETVHAKFSALQVIGVTALSNITNSAVNAGKRIVASLGDSLINGGRNRAQKIKDAKFQMEGLLGSEEYAKQWNRIDQSINYAVADTAYGYDSAARAASQFLASNVKVGDQMDRSLRAISGVAAMTNSTYDDIANVFTRVAGQSRVMAVDLNSLASRGLNAAAVLGKSLNKSESEIRDMVSKGKISFQDFADAMDEAFGEHAKKGNETFQGALANMKAAMSRIGAKVWDPLLDNQRDVFNQARLLINDLNKNYLDGPINSLNEKLTSVFQNIVKFFELGGVKNILLGIGNTLSFISSVIKPIKDAFKEIFPPKSVETLVKYTKQFRELTAGFKLSEKTATNLKNTFKGVFSVLNTGISLISSLVRGFGQILSNLTGIPGGILGITGALGAWVTRLSEAIKQSNIFNNVIQGLVNIFEGFSNKFKEFTKHFNVFEGLVNGIKRVFTTLGKILQEFTKMLGEALRTGDIKAALDVFNTGVFSGIILNIKNVTKTLDLFFRKANAKSITGNLSLIIGSLKDNLYALQFTIKADALMKIAKAIAVLAGSLFVLSLIKPDRLGSALVGMGILITEIVVALRQLDKFADQSFKNLAKLSIVTSTIRSLATSLLILSAALRILGTMDIKQMGVALIGMAAGLKIMCETLKQMSKYYADLTMSAKAIRKLATSLVVLAVALKIMGTMDIKQMGVALLGMTTGLIFMTKAIQKMPTYKKGKDKIASMLKIAFSLILLGAALKILASIGWPNILTALGAMGGALAILVRFVYALPKNLKQLNAKVNALNMMALGLGFLGFILKDLGKMSWEQVKTSLVAMGGALAEILIFTKLLSAKGGSLKGMSAMIGLATGILILATAMKLLATLNVGGLIISLIALGGAFVIVRVAAKLLGGAVPVILAVSAAIALFGAGMWMFSAGVLKLAAGIAALAAALTGGVTTIVAGIQAIILGVAQLVPELIKIFGESIVTLCKVIMTSAPMIGETILVVIHESLKSLVAHGPEIVALLFQFVIGILHELKNYIPEFIVAAMEVVDALFKGIVMGLKEIDPSKVLPAVLAIGVLTGIFIALATLSHMVPQAMLGVLGFGALVVELAAVLALVGGLSKIPGIKEIVADGGNFLQIVGTAIGQFIGGLYGGVAKGFSASMPDIGKNLSEFMTNLQPFINGCRTIDKSVLTGVTILTAAVLEITAANLYANICKFLTLGSSFADLGKELSDFMNNAKDFVTGSQQLKPESLKGISILADTIIKLTGAGFLDSITKWLSGESSLSSFARELVPFGQGLKEFASTVEGINSGAIIEAARAADGLVELSNKVPNRGGLKQFFGGKQSLLIFGGELKAFGEGIKQFSDAIAGINVENIDKAIGSADKLIELSNKVPNRKGMGQWFSGKKSLKVFGGELEAFADGLKAFSDKVAGLDLKNMTYATKAADVLIDLCNKVPNRAGMAQWFTGKQSLEIFGGELEAFGKGVKSFSNEVKDLDSSSINNAIDAADKLIQLTHKVPNRAGMAQWFTGKQSLELFGGELKAFGTGIKDFGEEIKDINVENIGKATSAAKGLAELTNILPNRQGMTQWFTGKQSVAVFGKELKTFGTGIKDFCNEVKDVKMENTTDVVNAVKTLAEAAGALPEVKGKELEKRAKGFGEGIGHIANGFKCFFEKLNGCNFNIDTINSAVNGVKTLSEVFNNLPDKDGGKIENRGWGLGVAIDHFANGMSSFVNKMNGTSLDSNFITNVANSIKTMAEAVNALPDKDGGKIENRAWGLGEAMEHFGNGLTTLYLGEFDAEKAKSAADVVKTFADVFPSLPDKDGGKIENRAWGMGCAIGHYANGLKQLDLSNFDSEKAKIAAEVVKSFADTFNSLPDKDGGKIENRAWGMGCAIGHYANGLKQLDLSNFDPEKAKIAADVIRHFADTFNSLPDKDGGTIENRAWGLGEAIKHYANGLKAFCETISESAFDKVQDAINYIKQFADITPNIPDNAGAKLSGFAEGINQLAPKFGEFINSLNGIDFTNVDTSFANIKKLLDSLDSVSNFNMDNVNNISSALKTISESLTNLANVPAEAADNFNNALKTLGQNGMTSFLDSFKNIQTDMKTKATEGITGFTAGVTDNQEIATTALENLHATCKECIVPSDYEDIGKYVVEGFARGISSNVKLATDAMSILTAKVEAQARQDLDINSPSKLFRKIGSGIPEGFVQGIGMFGSSVKKSVMNMSSNAIDSTRKVLSRIGNIINSDTENTMTLRPILDLSEVKSGVSQIGSLFGQPSLAVATNIGAISSNFRGRNQNGNTEVVSAIDKLRKDLGGVKGDTYVIDGITYDNGSEIQEAVSTLVRAAKIERRT